jgi:hypothetical protein
VRLRAPVFPVFFRLIGADGTAAFESFLISIAMLFY